MGYIKGDQLNMAVFFWYLIESDLYSVHVYSSLLKRYQKHMVTL